MLDEFTPIAIYEKTKEFFENEICYLFESVVNTNDGNFSYIVCGEYESIWSSGEKSFYKKDDQIQQISSNPLEFLKEYYKKIDFQSYRQKSKELDIGFIDGFIGYIGYDMVKEFEPVLKPYMNSLRDDLHIPDLYMIRPKLIIAYAHKKSQLTMITPLEAIAKEIFDPLQKSIQGDYTYHGLKRAKLLGDPTFAHSKEKFFEMVQKSK